MDKTNNSFHCRLVVLFLVLLHRSSINLISILGAATSPPGWDAGPSKVYLQHSVRWYPFIQLNGERQCGEKFLSKETTQLQGPGLEPQTFRLKVRGVNDYITVPPDFNHYKGERN